MKPFKDLLKELSACNDAIEWASDKTIEEIVDTCHRGDWLLWLAKKIDLPIREFVLAKAKCAKTVIHLMEDERSINAVNVAEQFGLGNATLDELNAVAYTAVCTAAYAAYVAADAMIKNQKETADICREILGDLIINKVKQLQNETI